MEKPKSNPKANTIPVRYYIVTKRVSTLNIPILNFPNFFFHFRFFQKLGSI